MGERRVRLVCAPTDVRALAPTATPSPFHIHTHTRARHKQTARAWPPCAPAHRPHHATKPAAAAHLPLAVLPEPHALPDGRLWRRRQGLHAVVRVAGGAQHHAVGLDAAHVAGLQVAQHHHLAFLWWWRWRVGGWVGVGRGGRGLGLGQTLHAKPLAIALTRTPRPPNTTEDNPEPPCPPSMSAWPPIARPLNPNTHPTCICSIGTNSTSPDTIVRGSASPTSICSTYRLQCVRAGSG